MSRGKRCPPGAALVIAVALGTGGLAVLHPPPLAGQETLSPQDSTRLVRAARSAQGRFESTRRRNLPWTNRTWGGQCDERIGRFCLWHSGREETDWDPPEEPEAVTEARNELIDVLDSAARQIPGDEWVGGHTVWYLLEADRHEEALEVTERCRSPRAWWCTALRGFVLHHQRDYPAAEAAFEAALSVMDDDERRAWTSIEPLLEVEAASRYRRTSGQERDAFESRFWWLANPFYSIPGNDRRSEHFARSVIDHIQWRARTPEGISWGGDLRTLLLRYGWPRGWERVRETRPGLHAPGPPPIVSRYGTGRRFSPTEELLDEPFAKGADAWVLRPPAGRESYRAAYAPRVEPLQHQIARFARSDSTRIVAAYRLPDPEEPAEDEDPPPTARAALAVSAGPGEAPHLVSRTAVARDGFGITLLADSLLVSLEVIPDTPAIGYRARTGVVPLRLHPDLPALSDLLILDPEAGEPTALEAAERWARGSTSLREGEEIAVFFELYNPHRVGDEVRVSAMLEPRDRAWLARLAERLRLRTPEPPVRVRWTEEMDPARRELVGRTLRMRIPDVPPARYWLRLEVDLAGREPLRASRAVEVEAP
jgi:hypothetical protein